LQLQNIPLLILRLCLSILHLTWEDPNLFGYHQKVDGCVGTMALEAWFHGDIIVHHMLNQVLKLSAHPNPMPSENWVKFKCYQHTSAIHQVVVIWNYLVACKIFELKLAIGWSWANQGISLIDHFIWVYMSWLDWINMQCCSLWDVWMDK
jgi:hypothetical protein